MTDIQTTYDATQHCTSVKVTRSKTVAMDCPYTGKGEEFSPTNLVEAALGGCILLAMGAIATRHELDLSGSRVDVSISATDKPVMRFKEIEVDVGLPESLSERQRAMLEKAADGCPIKHSFASDIPVKVRYHYQPRRAESDSVPQPVLD